jgi:hypothetical protein
MSDEFKEKAVALSDEDAEMVTGGARLGSEPISDCGQQCPYGSIENPPCDTCEHSITIKIDLF